MKTQAQIDRATDLRLQKTYGITLYEYDKMFSNQDGGCAVCGNPPKSRRLHVDHDHGWKKVKISTLKMASGRWLASATYADRLHVARAEKKSAAAQALKVALLRRSTRGLLCTWCNRGLRFYHDNPVFMESAAQYLRKHQGTLNKLEVA